MISSLPTDDTTLTELGRRLTQQRIRQGLTQAALAEQAGVSKRTLEHLEAGDGIQLSSFLRILRQLNLLDRLDQLIPDEGPSPLDAVRSQRKRRKRASSPRPRDAKPTGWTWGDEA